MFKSSIMGPKKIKHATLNAPVINAHINSKRSNWPTFKTQSHKAPKGKDTKPTKAPQGYHRS
jgi:hypothetical protein